jgi:DNA polymerase I-like protein with 3'-5' exonuclease and polymerase domains
MYINCCIDWANLLLNIDIKGTEWVGINWFSQDPVGCQEIRDGVDQHALNQKVFDFPDRVIAKIFVFRLIYGGSAWSYVYDPDFNWISKNPNYWQKAIDTFYDKYRGIGVQHKRWMDEAIRTNQLVMPTGRVYPFEPKPDKRGDMQWPRTQIINYPVQGIGHDLTTIARVSLWKRVQAHEYLGRTVHFICTVHDSIVLDLKQSDLAALVPLIRAVFIDIPLNFGRLFNVNFNLPIKGELKVGSNLLDMEEVL